MSNYNSHKLFLYVIFFIWLLIPIADTLAHYISYDGFSTFRAWEIVTRGRGQGPFAPSVSFEKTIYGDLANILKVRKFRQYRHQLFTTDSYGFRNIEAPAETYYPIVVVGDSDMAGSSLSDDETFSFQLSKSLNIPIYNYAPYSPIYFLGDERFKKYPPKILIWESVERTIQGSVFKRYAELPDNTKVQFKKKVSVQESHLPRSRLSTQLAREIFHELRWYLTGIKPEAISFIHQQSGMLFYTPGVKQLTLDSNDRDIKGIIAGIKQIQKILQNQGITLLYIPLPDKENIYRKMLPDDIPGKDSKEFFLQDLNTALIKSGVHTVDLYSLFNKASVDQDYLYFRDDTHWNKKGVSMAVEAVIEYLEEHSLNQDLHCNP